MFQSATSFLFTAFVSFVFLMDIDRMCSLVQAATVLGSRN